MTYKIKFEFTNGYKCGCCRCDWTHDIDIKVDKFIENFQLKSAHDISCLEEEVFNQGCKLIYDYENDGDEFLDSYQINYRFYNYGIENDCNMEWDTPFNLKPRWDEYRKALNIEREANKKAARILQLEAELKRLKS